MFINVHNKIFTFDSKWNTRCKDSANRRQNKIKKRFFIFFVEMQPILSKDTSFITINHTNHQSTTL